MLDSDGLICRHDMSFFKYGKTGEKKLQCIFLCMPNNIIIIRSTAATRLSWANKHEQTFLKEKLDSFYNNIILSELYCAIWMKWKEYQSRIYGVEMAAVGWQGHKIEETDIYYGISLLLRKSVICRRERTGFLHFSLGKSSFNMSEN
jgi:hypothetical protein